MTPTHKIQTYCRLEVPRVGGRIGNEGESVVIEPKVIEATLTRGDYRTADELRLVFDWRDAGVDPRFVGNAVVAFYAWDESAIDGGTFQQDRHLRFTGIAAKPARKLSGDDMRAEILFQDWTTLFIAAKPFPREGIPDWTMTLQQAWERIVDHTGVYDVTEGAIMSTVAALRDKLVFRLSDPSRESAMLGEAVPRRFLAMSKPSPPDGSDAWGVWLYCCELLGLISYVEEDRVVVTDALAHFDESRAPSLIWGRNILTLEEHHDTSVAAKGILLRTFDPINGRLIEALYPPPGDPRVRAKRATVRKPHAAPTFNDLASHYDVFTYGAFVDEVTLQRRAQMAWELRSREELEGSLTTAEMTIDTVDVLDLHAGDPIVVRADEAAELIMQSGTVKLTDDDCVRQLMDLGYAEDVARVLVSNRALEWEPVYHIKQLQVTIGPEKYEVKIDYQNRIQLTP